MARVFVLWDESHLWGVLVLRALRALRLPHGILRATDIAEGALAGKPTPFAPFGGVKGGSAPSDHPGPPNSSGPSDTSGFSNPSGPSDSSAPPALLIVPGGWARGRALRLGPAGMQAIRDFVASGGSYLGFCGGAGLALTSPRPGESLNLCPWGRMGFAGRLQHFLSGHVRLECDASSRLCPPETSALDAPVWWPAQFAPPPRDSGPDGVEVLARYAGLGDDFWVADLNLALLPEETLRDWENLYGLQVRPDFLKGRPAVISGTYGQGRYVLSYPHLETPDSPQANAWFAHVVEQLAKRPADGLGRGFPTSATVASTVAPIVEPAAAPASPLHTEPGIAIPPWRVGQDAPLWPDPALLAAKAALERAIAVGENHMLLFWRNPWLLGWRRGLPGPGINSLYALVCEALAHPAPAPGSPALSYWEGHAAEFARLSELFCSALSGLLLAERLDMTVRATEGVDGADQAFTTSLRETRRALFGAPPAIGGLCGELLGMLEELCARLWGAAAPPS